MGLKNKKQASLIYSIILMLIGLAITGLIVVALNQYLGIKLHFMALDLGANAETLGVLDTILAWLPIALIAAAAVYMISNAYRARYQL